MRSQIGPQTISRKANTNTYGFTLRKLKNPNKSYQLLRAKMEWLEKKFKGIVTEYHFENCESGQPHVHGVLEAPMINNLRHIKVRGWSNDLKLINNIQEWNKYIRKKAYEPSDEEILDLARYKSNPLKYNLFRRKVPKNAA